MESRRGNLNLLIVVLLAAVILIGGGVTYLASRQPPTMIEETETPSEAVPPGETGVVVRYDDDVPSDDVALIDARIVSPLREYHAQVAGKGTLVSVVVSTDPEQDAAHPYYVQISYSDREAQVYTIARGADGELAWWRPTCETTCIFPEAFSQKYPEVLHMLSPTSR